MITSVVPTANAARKSANTGSRQDWRTGPSMPRASPAATGAEAASREGKVMHGASIRPRFGASQDGRAIGQAKVGHPSG